MSGSIPPAGTLPTGTRVRLHAIASQPRLNGRCGTIAGYQPKSHRYEVQLLGFVAGGPSRIMIKPGRVVQAVVAQVQGIRSDSSLNGRSCAVVDFDAATGRYKLCLVKSGAAVSDDDLSANMLLLRPKNVVLPEGCYVRHASTGGRAAWPSGAIGRGPPPRKRHMSGRTRPPDEPPSPSPSREQARREREARGPGVSRGGSSHRGVCSTRVRVRRGGRRANSKPRDRRVRCSNGSRREPPTRRTMALPRRLHA